MLEEGLAWLSNALKSSVAKAVTYRRGTEEVSVKATIGKTLLKLSDDFGNVRMEWTDRDFLIAADDLVIAGEQVLPQRGDRIIEQQGTKTFVYEVLAPGGEPEWRWCDPCHKLLRIHTKEVL